MQWQYNQLSTVSEVYGYTILMYYHGTKKQFFKMGLKHHTVMMVMMAFSKLLQPVILLKVTLLHGSFSRFLNCANGTKLRKASQVITHNNNKNNK